MITRVLCRPLFSFFISFSSNVIADDISPPPSPEGSHQCIGFFLNNAGVSQDTSFKFCTDSVAFKITPEQQQGIINCIKFNEVNAGVSPNTSFEFCTGAKAPNTTLEQQQEIINCIKFHEKNDNIDPNTAFKRCTQIVVR